MLGAGRGLGGRRSRRADRPRPALLRVDVLIRGVSRGIGVCAGVKVGACVDGWQRPKARELALGVPSGPRKPQRGPARERCWCLVRLVPVRQRLARVLPVVRPGPPFPAP